MRRSVACRDRSRTRNELQELTRDIEAIQTKTRERHAAKESLERAVVDAVSAFDSGPAVREAVSRAGAHEAGAAREARRPRCSTT